MLKAGNCVVQEVELRESAEKEKSPYRIIIKLDEAHQLYEDELEQEELALEGKVKYEPAAEPRDGDDGHDTYAAGLIQDAFENMRDGLDLSRRSMVHVPEYLGRIVSLVRLNLSSNQLQVRFLCSRETFGIRQIRFFFFATISCLYLALLTSVLQLKLGCPPTPDFIFKRGECESYVTKSLAVSLLTLGSG